MFHLAKSIFKKLILRERASSESYISYLRRLGITIGDNVTVYDPQRTFIDTTRPYLIEIGSRVHIARGVTILSHGYDWDVFRNTFHDVVDSAAPTTIGNNVFLGMNSVILKGVSIGDNSIVGAGSVVTKSFPPNSVVGGVPAKILMSLNEYYEKRKIAYANEAILLAKRYFKVYNKPPKEHQLVGFHRLFLERTAENASRYGIEGEFYNTFMSSQPLWNGFANFLHDAINSPKSQGDIREQSGVNHCSSPLGDPK